MSKHDTDPDSVDSVGVIERGELDDVGELGYSEGLTLVVGSVKIGSEVAVDPSEGPLVGMDIGATVGGKRPTNSASAGTSFRSIGAAKCRSGFAISSSNESGHFIVENGNKKSILKFNSRKTEKKNKKIKYFGKNGRES